MSKYDTMSDQAIADEVVDSLRYSRTPLDNTGNALPMLTAYRNKWHKYVKSNIVHSGGYPILITYKDGKPYIAYACVGDPNRGVSRVRTIYLK